MDEEERNGCPLLDEEGDASEALPEFKRRYDLTGVRPRWGSMSGGLRFPRYTLRYGGAEFAPLGGIHALTGQSGHGKTMTFSLLMAAALRGSYGGIEWCGEGEPPSVLYVDTEMEYENTQLVIARVRWMAGWRIEEDGERLKWLSLRTEESVDQRWRQVLRAIEDMHPTVVFLDGLLDMADDFNDNKEASGVVWRCMAMAQWYGISLWCLAHQNYGQDKMTGHLGSILNRKVTDEFATVRRKEGGVTFFTVEQRKARGAPVPDMTFGVRAVDVDLTRQLGVPVMVEAAAETEERPAPAALSVEEAVRSVLGGGALSMGELREAIKEKLGAGTQRADGYIREAARRGLVETETEDSGGGRPRTMYRLRGVGEKTFTESDEDKLPF